MLLADCKRVQCDEASPLQQWVEGRFESPTSAGKDVEKRHRNQSVAMMVMSHPSFPKCWCKRGSFATTSSCMQPASYSRLPDPWPMARS